MPSVGELKPDPSGQSKDTANSPDQLADVEVKIYVDGIVAEKLNDAEGEQIHDLYEGTKD